MGLATRKGNLEIVKKMLDKGVNPNTITTVSVSCIHFIIILATIIFSVIFCILE